MKHRARISIAIAFVALAMIDATARPVMAQDNPFAFLSAIFAPQKTSKEGSCGVGPPLVSASGFQGGSGAPIDKVTEEALRRSTVRLKIADTDTVSARLLEAARGQPSNLRLNDFESRDTYANVVYCTGTLVRDDIIVSAGHCFSPTFWETNSGVKFPQIRSGGEWKPLSEYQFAKLLVADINYTDQTMDSPAPVTPGTGRPAPEVVAEAAKYYWEFSIRTLISQYYDPLKEGVDRDFAIARLKSYEGSVGRQFALETRRLAYSSPKVGSPLVIFQHPNGSALQFGTGKLVHTKSARIGYGITTFEGSSGAGVLDVNGNLIGIHVESGCGLKETPPNNKGLPLARIQSELRREIDNGSGAAARSVAAKKQN